MILHESKNMTPMVASIEVGNEYDYQIVYASQLYGTFFTVGAKLELSEDDSSIIGICLALNNYKGLYNIGMLDHTRNTFLHKNGKALIILHLMVDNGKNTDKLKRKVSMNLSKPIPIDEIDELNFTRVIHSLTEVNSPEDHLDESIFDSEFYVRNGKYIAAIDRLDMYLPKPNIENKGVKSAKSNKQITITGDPDTNCMNSKVKLIKK